MAINWTNALVSGAGLYDQYNRLGDIGERAIEGTNQLGQQAVEGTQFKPFSVYTGPSNVYAEANGTMDITHNPETQAFIDQLTGGSQGFFNQATQGTGAREQDIYDRIRATQMPEEQRAQDMMDGRLTAQGRSGIQSNAYGGTPEQLAYHKAVQEAQNNASLSAIQQGQAEQAQQASLGGMFQNASYLPQAQALNAFNPAINVANMGQTGQIAGQNLSSQMGLGGLMTQINAEKMRSDLIGQALGTAGNAFSQSGSDPVGSGLGWLWDQLGFGGQ